MAEQPWKQWAGRVQRAEDWITPQRVAAWYAMLDRSDASHEATPAPLGFHWTLAPPLVRESELGPDGHPLRDANSFLPPIPMPRRMWAGSRVTFHRPLLIGDRVERESVITTIEEKKGRASELVFVTVRHRFTTELGLAIDEEQDLVYRPPPPSDAPENAAPTRSAITKPRWQRAIHPSETLLFRFSALTFNGHRIHYDRRYATEVEKYPGLVVHAPLIATLLLDLLRSAVPNADVERFTFKALRPTFNTSDFSLSADPAMEDNHRFELWSTDNHGERAVEAHAWIR